MSQRVPEAVVLWAMEQYLLQNGGKMPEEGGIFELDALISVKGQVRIGMQRGIANADQPLLARQSRSITTDVSRLNVSVVQDMRHKAFEEPEFAVAGS